MPPGLVVLPPLTVPLVPLVLTRMEQQVRPLAKHAIMDIMGLLQTAVPLVQLTHIMPPGSVALPLLTA